VFLMVDDEERWRRYQNSDNDYLNFSFVDLDKMAELPPEKLAHVLRRIFGRLQTVRWDEEGISRDIYVILKEELADSK